MGGGFQTQDGWEWGEVFEVAGNIRLMYESLVSADDHQSDVIIKLMVDLS